MADQPRDEHGRFASSGEVGDAVRFKNLSDGKVHEGRIVEKLAFGYRAARADGSVARVSPERVLALRGKDIPRTPEKKHGADNAKDGRDYMKRWAREKIDDD